MKIVKMVALSLLLVSPLAFAPPPSRAPMRGRHKGVTSETAITPSEKTQKLNELKERLKKLEADLSKAKPEDKAPLNYQIRAVKEQIAYLESGNSPVVAY